MLGAPAGPASPLLDPPDRPSVGGGMATNFLGQGELVAKPVHPHYLSSTSFLPSGTNGWIRAELPVLPFYGHPNYACRRSGREPSIRAPAATIGIWV